MKAQIIHTSQLNSYGAIYQIFEVDVEGKDIIIMVVTGRYNYINIIINDSNHNINGEEFESYNQALNNYKDSKIKTAIRYIQTLNNKKLKSWKQLKQTSEKKHLKTFTA